MPSHAARACGHAIGDVVAGQAFDARARRGAVGLFLLERAALALGVGTRRFVGGEPLAHDFRRGFEFGFDRRLDVGVGEQLDPRHARGRVGFAQLGEIVHVGQLRHLRDEVPGALLIGFLVGRSGLGRGGGLFGGLDQACAPSSARLSRAPSG